MWLELVNAVMNFGFHKMRGYSRLAENQSASQERLCSLEQVSKRFLSLSILGYKCKLKLAKIELHKSSLPPTQILFCTITVLIFITLCKKWDLICHYNTSTYFVHSCITRRWPNWPKHIIKCTKSLRK